MKVEANFRVVCVPLPPYWHGKPEKEDAEMLLRNIDRHCSVIDIKVESDWVCSFCGSPWETEQSGEPMCCRAAQTEWRTESGADK